MALEKSEGFYDSIKAMQQFAETYAKQTNTFFSVDPR
ncbi:unnamed protein product [Ascophyllum nodosum]